MVAGILNRRPERCSALRAQRWDYPPVDVGDAVLLRQLGVDEGATRALHDIRILSERCNDTPGEFSRAAGVAVKLRCHAGDSLQALPRTIGVGKPLPQRNRRHVVRLELDGHVARHAVHSALTDTENHTERIGDPNIAGGAGDETGLLRCHDPSRMPGRHKVGAEADSDHPLPVGKRLFPEWPGFGQIGGIGDRIVDQNIEAPVLAAHPLKQRRDLIVLRKVHWSCDPLAAAARHFLGGLTYRAAQRMRARGDSPARDVHGGTLFPESDRNTPADATTRSGNNYNLTRQTFHVLSLLLIMAWRLHTRPPSRTPGEIRRS